MRITVLLIGLLASSIASFSSSVSVAQESTAKLDPAMAASKASNPNLDWYDVTKWGIEGRILPDQDRKLWFDRLPSSAEGKVTDVPETGGWIKRSVSFWYNWMLLCL